ncbi:MAG: radical SAM protein [Candidatus Marinimicrobia bacterium]|nr:radical SAM protein [Candidatus Neomarinimicrobiota bacterium]
MNHINKSDSPTRVKSSTPNDVLLFIPNTRWFNKRPWMVVPHSALILTAILKENHDFFLLDANALDLSEAECLQQIKTISPRIFLVSGISVEYFQQYHKAFEIVKQATPDCITVFGGIYPSLMSEEALQDKNIDYIFIGPAEGGILEFIHHLLEGQFEEARKISGIGYCDANGENIIRRPKSTEINIDPNIKPDYSKIDVEFYLTQSAKEYNYSFQGPTAILLTSYGCRYNCSFCAARTIRGRGINYRSTEDVLEEIDSLIQNHGVRHLSFLDECFLDDREHAMTIMQAFIDRKYNITWKMPNVSAWHLDDELLELMKDSGCKMITVSVESGNDRVLHKIIRKPVKLGIFPNIVRKCNELGIEIAANFVIGMPGETWDEIRETFRFAEAMNFDLVSFHIATPYPKTDLYKIAKEQNLLPENFDFRNPKYFGTSEGFITTDEFTPLELKVLRAYEWDRINFKTPENIEKIARMMFMSVEQLNDHRKQTRTKLGIHH